MKTYQCEFQEIFSPMKKHTVVLCAPTSKRAVKTAYMALERKGFDPCVLVSVKQLYVKEKNDGCKD